MLSHNMGDGDALVVCMILGGGGGGVRKTITKKDGSATSKRTVIQRVADDTSLLVNDKDKLSKGPSITNSARKRVISVLDEKDSPVLLPRCRRGSSLTSSQR